MLYSLAVFPAGPEGTPGRLVLPPSWAWNDSAPCHCAPGIELLDTRKPGDEPDPRIPVLQAGLSRAHGERHRPQAVLSCFAPLCPAPRAGHPSLHCPDSSTSAREGPPARVPPAPHLAPSACCRSTPAMQPCSLEVQVGCSGVPRTWPAQAPPCPARSPPFLVRCLQGCLLFIRTCDPWPSPALPLYLGTPRGVPRHTVSRNPNAEL